MVLVLSSAAAALIPVSREADQTSSSTTSTGATVPRGELRRETLRTAANEAQTIRLRAGDELVLRVISKAADQVEPGGLGEVADVDPDSPAEFDLLLSQPGTYTVRLLDAKRDIGRIVVRERGGDQDGAKPADSPGESTTGLTPGALRAI